MIHMRQVVSRKRWISFIINENGLEYLFYCIPNLFDICLNYENMKLTDVIEHHPFVE